MMYPLLMDSLMQDSDGTDLEGRFKAAVNWLAAKLELRNEDAARPDAPLVTQKSILLETLLVTKSEGRLRFRSIDEKTAQNLIVLVQTDQASHDLVCRIVSQGLLGDASRGTAVSVNGRSVETTNEMPDVLRVVGALILDGTIPRPKQRGATTAFRRDVVYQRLIEEACCRFALKPTRSSSTRPKRSGCDALIDAIRRSGGQPPSFDAVRRVWQNKQVRENFRHYIEMERLKIQVEGASRPDCAMR